MQGSNEVDDHFLIESKHGCDFSHRSLRVAGEAGLKIEVDFQICIPGIGES